MKKCFKCKENKDLTEFYHHPSTKDGRLNKCKECTKSDVRSNYSLRIEQYREYDKKRQRKDIRRIYSHRYNQIRARVGGFASRRYKVEGTEMLTREEFDKWCEENQHIFDRLYSVWEENNFSRTFAPSIDRVDSNGGYTLNNMQWLSFSDNAAKKDK